MKRTVLTILLLAVIALLAACVSTEQTPTPAPALTEAPTAAPTLAAKTEPVVAAGAFGEAWESVSCDTFQVAPEVAAVADGGYVTVPENRAKGGDKTIQLAVARERQLL
jgi:photosystem II stability/assembly factor-like uncharacterized protein